MPKFHITVKLGDEEWLNSEEPGYSEPFPVTNLPVYFVDSKQPGVKGRSILFNHFIDMRTTINLSISCRKNVFLLKTTFSNKYCGPNTGWHSSFICLAYFVKKEYISKPFHFNVNQLFNAETTILKKMYLFHP